ncbi:hypothetical protein I317_00526 [Kwoniella heveanensis CBS 569]|nr:hypothetical protein I317_00526 [Kwoniella heveanensis CBS 569]
MTDQTAVTRISRRVLGLGASAEAQETLYELGPLDRLALHWLPIIVVFLYPEPIDPPTLTRAIEVLFQEGGYSHLTGRLHVDSDRPESTCVNKIGSGVEFHLAKAGSPEGGIRSYIQDGSSSLASFPDDGLCLLPPYPPPQFDSSLTLPEDHPLLSVQLTQFPQDTGGGSALAFRLSHIVADAHGFTNLLKDLSSIYTQLSKCSDSPSIPNVPQVKAYRPGPADFNHEQDSFKPKLYSLDPPIHGPFSDKAVGKVLRFDKATLSSLKGLATPPANTTTTATSSEGWVSTFDALSAHLYLSVHRARVSIGRPLSPPDYFTSINLRKHLQHVLCSEGVGDPQRYFPNCTLNPFLTISSEKLVTAPLSEIAAILHDLPRSITPKEAERTIEWLTAHPAAHHGFRFGNGCFMVTQWTGFDLYGIELGGRPLKVSLPFTPQSLFDGLAYFMPTEEQGAIDVYLTLTPEVWDVLEGGEALTRIGGPTSG